VFYADRFSSGFYELCIFGAAMLQPDTQADICMKVILLGVVHNVPSSRQNEDVGRRVPQRQKKLEVQSWQTCMNRITPNPG